MKRPIIFRYVNLAFPRLYCLKFSFKLANISRSYEENTMTPFSFHVLKKYGINVGMLFVKSSLINLGYLGACAPAPP